MGAGVGKEERENQRTIQTGILDEHYFLPGNYIRIKCVKPRLQNKKRK